MCVRTKGNYLLVWYSTTLLPFCPFPPFPADERQPDFTAAHLLYTLLTTDQFRFQLWWRLTLQLHILVLRSVTSDLSKFSTTFTVLPSIQNIDPWCFGKAACLLQLPASTIIISNKHHQKWIRCWKTSIFPRWNDAWIGFWHGLPKKDEEVSVEEVEVTIPKLRFQQSVHLYPFYWILLPSSSRRTEKNPLCIYFRRKHTR